MILYITFAFILILFIYFANLYYRTLVLKKIKYLFDVGVIKHYNHITMNQGIYNPFSSWFYMHTCKDVYNALSKNEYTHKSFSNSKYLSYSSNIKIRRFINDLGIIYNEVKENELFYYLVSRYKPKAQKLLTMVTDINTSHIDDNYYIDVAGTLEPLIKDEHDRTLLYNYLSALKVPTYEIGKGIVNRKMHSELEQNEKTCDNDAYDDKIIKQYIEEK